MLIVVVLSLVGAVVFGVVVNPVAAVIPLLVGGIVANRLGYRHQGEAVARAIQAPAPVAPAAEDVADKIARLADLRDRGAITPEEYEAKKAELLTRL